MNDYTSRPRAVASASHFAENGLHLLVHPTQPRWLVLNDLGYEVALLCDGHKSVAQIAHCLAHDYNLKTDLAAQQVKQYLSSLAEKGWLSTSVEAETETFYGLESLSLQITERCNLRCRHCHAWNARLPAELSFQQIKKLIDEAADLGVRVLTLSGGEPLLHPQFREIINYAGSRFVLQVLTNGTLIDGSMADFLAKQEVRVQISLDGVAPRTHDRNRGDGSFVKSLESIRLLQKSGVNVTICTVNMRGNMGEQEEMIRLARSCGNVSLRFIPLRCSGRAERNRQELEPALPEYISFYRRHLLGESYKLSVSCGLSGLIFNLPAGKSRWCPVGRSLNINACGEAYPCLFLPEEKHCLGNINQVSLTKIFSSARLDQMRQIRDRRAKAIPKCAACAWKNLCQGGCMGLAYSQKRNLWETDDFCDLRRELYPKLIFNLAQKKLHRNQSQTDGFYNAA